MGESQRLTESLHDWRRAIFRWGIWNITYRFWIKLHVAGWENIPSENPVLMMGNHIAALDPGIIISFFPDRDIVPLAKTEAFEQPVLRYFVRHWGAIRVNRGEADLKALKLAFEHMNSGSIVMLYAEGTRSPSGLIEGQEGTAYMGVKTNAMIVPVAIWGSRGFPRTWLQEYRRTKVYVQFGRPFRFKQEGGKLPREHFRAMTDEAMYRIAELLPEELRGCYSELDRATTEFLDFDFPWTPVTTRLPRRVLESKRVTIGRLPLIENTTSS